MTVKQINGAWRIVYRATGEIANQTKFESEADAWAYLDKFEDLRGQF